MAMGNNGSHCACLFGSLCPFIEVRSLTRRVALPDDDDDNDGDGDGVTGDNNALATGDNGSNCACSFGSLCPFVEVRSLMRQLALPDDDDDGNDDDDDDDGDGMTGDDDAMVTGENGSHCACSFGSLCPFVEVGSLMR